jgi:maltose alpha-D-glucosyltransferase/alpha-amylase
VLGAENPSALAYVREYDDDVILCVNNLSRFAQPVELQLGRFDGWHPVELLGRVPFPRIGELPYFITLGSHDFYWFQLVAEP